MTGSCKHIQDYQHQKYIDKTINQSVSQSINLCNLNRKNKTFQNLVTNYIGDSLHVTNLLTVL